MQVYAAGGKIAFRCLPVPALPEAQRHKLIYPLVNTILLSYQDILSDGQTLAAIREFPKSVTFIPDSPVTASGFRSILDPIIRLGEEADLDFEILLPAVRGDQDSLKVSMESYDYRISIYPVGSRNGALGFLTELASTTYISFFSSRIPTDLWIADIVSEYFWRNERRLLISDLTVFPRSMLISAGGLGNYGRYSLLDFYEKASSLGGIIACPTGNRSLSFFDPESMDSIFSSEIGEGELSFREMDLLRRSANLSRGDLILMLRGSPQGMRISRYLKAILARKRKSPAHSLLLEDAGYVKFMEAIVESIIFTDYLNFVPGGKDIKLRVGRSELRLLEKRSPVWSRSMHTIGRFLVVEGDSRP